MFFKPAYWNNDFWPNLNQLFNILTHNKSFMLRKLKFVAKFVSNFLWSMPQNLGQIFYQNLYFGKFALAKIYKKRWLIEVYHLMKFSKNNSFSWNCWKESALCNVPISDVRCNQETQKVVAV